MITMKGILVNASEAERKMFESSFDGMKQGWKGTLDQLAGYLGKEKR